MTKKSNRKTAVAEKNTSFNVAKDAPIWLLSPLSLGIVGLLLLIPSYSGAAIFSKGDFRFTEACGLLMVDLAAWGGLIAFFAKKITQMWTLTSLQRVLLMAVAVSTQVLFGLLMVLLVWLRFEVRTQCLVAQRMYGGSCITALVSLVEDDTQRYRAKNEAIWALGQFGDARALPVLQRLYTGVIPEREPLDATISQYELKKAINLISGGHNVPALVWRHGIK